MRQPIIIDCDFPGGNILVDRVEDQEDSIDLYLHQDLRDTEGDWFYWYFRVRGAAGKNLRVTFTGSDVIGTRGPALSLDGGQTWDWLGRERVEGQTFTCSIPLGAEEARFSLGMPYLQSNLDKCMSQLPAGSPIKREVLCRSRRGREVEMLRAGRLDGQAPYCLLLTARHHCCEMMASYAMEGMLETVLGLDNVQPGVGEWLRANVEILAVPFMDKDGVEDGDQGKNRRPHDHNRDYGPKSIYPEVRALRELVPQWSAERQLLAFDLHCPWIRGEYNEWVYAVGADHLQNWERQAAYSHILESTQQAGLRYRGADNLAFGVRWNLSNAPLVNSTDWALQQPNILLANSLEIPYANANGAEVNQRSARAFGYDLARALVFYLTGQYA